MAENERELPAGDGGQKESGDESSLLVLWGEYSEWARGGRGQEVTVRRDNIFLTISTHTHSSHSNLCVNTYRNI